MVWKRVILGAITTGVSAFIPVDIVPRFQLLHLNSVNQLFFSRHIHIILDPVQQSSVRLYGHHCPHSAVSQTMTLLTILQPTSAVSHVGTSTSGYEGPRLTSRFVPLPLNVSISLLLMSQRENRNHNEKNKPDVFVSQIRQSRVSRVL